MEKRATVVREEQWIQTIAAAKQSGQSIKVWCVEHSVFRCPAFKSGSEK